MLPGRYRQRAKDAQEELLRRVNEETLRALKHAKDGAEAGTGTGRKVSEVISYKSVTDLPNRDLAIQACAHLLQHQSGLPEVVDLSSFLLLLLCFYYVTIFTACLQRGIAVMLKMLVAWLLCHPGL